MSHHVSLEDLAKLIKERRIELGLSSRGLGKLAGIDDSTIVRLEKGKQSPKPDNLVKLSAALKLPLSDLYHLAGYKIPQEDLPSMEVYIENSSDLPQDAKEELVTYYRQLKKKHGTKGKSSGSKPKR